jgi:hypothetical protein
MTSAAISALGLERSHSVAEHVPRFHCRHVAVEEVQVGAADGAGRHLDDDVAIVLDRRVWHAVAPDIALAVPAQCFHEAAPFFAV